MGITLITRYGVIGKIKENDGMDKLLLRATEVAAALQISRSTAYQLMAAGVLPTIRIGRSVRVPRAELERWIRDQTPATVGDLATAIPSRSAPTN